MSTSTNRLHVVNFSGGLCSFWSAWRVRERYGPENVVLLFADTLIEDEELYQFNAQASQLLRIPITRISQEVTPWQLFRRQGLIGNSRFPICSVMLKREPLDRWHHENCLDRNEEMQGVLWDDGRRPATLYVGFDWTEEHRLADLRCELSTWTVEAPMINPPIWDKCRMRQEDQAIGLKIPRLYELGFAHNNCGGGCVRAGISHFVHLYRVLPQRFLEWMHEETATRDELLKRGIEPFSVLKDRRGGFTKPLWLEDLKIRIDSEEEFQTDEWGGCGCGGATTERHTTQTSGTSHE